MEYDETTSLHSKALALDSASFLRQYQLRSSQIMWFLGAGASRAAGIKTAGDMIWDFKRRLYISEKKSSALSITDISDRRVQKKLQDYFDNKGSFPPAGSEEEYSAYFESTYPSSRDRRAYIDELVSRGQPSYGHLALALLMASELCKAVWTTNFDRTLEDAAAKIFGNTGDLITADLSEPEKIKRAWNEHKFPIYGKLHGDYHSERLKNTNKELKAQDESMRRNLIDSCKRQGLVVVGYSGRDKSIMDALDEAIDEGRGYPAGIYWFKRSNSTLYDGVVEFLSKAKRNGIDAYIVDAESFDELLSDIVRFLPQTAGKLSELDGVAKPRLKKHALRAASKKFPVLRTNALPIVGHPAMCRLIDCEIGGYQEIEAAICKAGGEIEAQRCRSGVLSFGSDSEIRKVFQPFNIQRYEHYAISSRQLEKESAERRLLRDALFRALGQQENVRPLRRGRSMLLLPNSKQTNTKFFDRSIGIFSGLISQTSIPWSEACSIRLDFHFDQLWLMLEPIVITLETDEASESELNQAREFVRKRRTARHNRLANILLDDWIKLLLGSNRETKRIKAFGISDGIDAEFEISGISAFSGFTT